jgi:hypothetical protein
MSDLGFACCLIPNYAVYAAIWSFISFKELLLLKSWNRTTLIITSVPPIGLTSFSISIRTPRKTGCKSNKSFASCKFFSPFFKKYFTEIFSEH